MANIFRWKLRSEKSKYKKILDTFKMGDPKGLEALRKKILLNHGVKTQNVSMEECRNLISGDMAEFQKVQLVIEGRGNSQSLFQFSSTIALNANFFFKKHSCRLKNILALPKY